MDGVAGEEAAEGGGEGFLLVEVAVGEAVGWRVFEVGFAGAGAEGGEGEFGALGRGAC